MVRAHYIYDGNKINHEEVVDANFLLTNNLGGFFLDYKTTKYRGLHTIKKTEDSFLLLKTVDSVEINKIITDIEISENHIKKTYGKTDEKILMHENGLLYEVKNYSGTSVLTLDIREIFSHDIKGNFYKIYDENGCIIIEFSKRIDKNVLYTHHVVIKTDAPYTPVKEWKSKHFEYDEKRKDSPYEWYVFEALKFNINGNLKAVIISSDDKSKGVGDANYLFYNSERIKNDKKSVKSNFGFKKKANMRTNTARHFAKRSLNNLLVNSQDYSGIYAGLPWFCQFWTRDEAISLGSFIKNKEYDISKNILFRQMNRILPDGRLSNRFPHSELGSADGVGLVFLRARELFEKKVLNLDDLNFVKERLKNSIERMEQFYMKNGLIYSKPHETWIDTGGDSDKRDGARIEIQAYMLNMYYLMSIIYKKLDDSIYKDYKKKELEMAKTVRTIFLKNDSLKDGSDDETQRPNVFLAYYAYPSLLKQEEWMDVFKNSIKSLWLDWGGFSTIDKNSKLFRPEYTGIDNLSYHRGDSWFFINNIAAISMYRLNHATFSYYIKKIMNASTDEILKYGALGAASEISSAKELRAEGCISQAWSNATYVEMIDEMFN